MNPNIITTIRLILTPLILWLASSDDTRLLVVCFVLFLLASFSDWLDGYLARRYDRVTPLGTLLDPLTDKMLVLGFLFLFSTQDLIPLWITLVILFRELLVCGMRGLILRQGELVGANWMGKTKFVLQILLIMCVLGFRILRTSGVAPAMGEEIICWFAIAVMLISVGFALNFLRWNIDRLR
jgi:CDP-diacylglycerol--glycerol-3-phosphate 3-phosphatidyltransferase